MVRSVSVTSIANCESLVHSRKRRPSHCPSVPLGDGYTFEDGSGSKLNTRGVAPLITIPVRSDGATSFKAYAPNTRAGLGRNPQQPRPIARYGSAHDRPALTIPVQDPHPLGSLTGVLAELEDERPRSPD